MYPATGEDSQKRSRKPRTPHEGDGTVARRLLATRIIANFRKRLSFNSGFDIPAVKGCLVSGSAAPTTGPDEHCRPYCFSPHTNLNLEHFLLAPPSMCKPSSVPGATRREAPPTRLTFATSPTLADLHLLVSVPLALPLHTHTYGAQKYLNGGSHI